MVELGYKKAGARTVATKHLAKIKDVNDMFAVKEVRSETHIITVKEGMALLTKIVESKAKKEIVENAQIILDSGLFSDAVLTEDDAYKPTKPSRRKVVNPKKDDYWNFIVEQGLEDDFKEWFKANK